ncbi:MAG: hypothetical protein R3339_00095 [Thermodesulfobacteriota bacterium]|nr:hypothetical protein [Thermodesulfobacteriota bacterium]
MKKIPWKNLFIICFFLCYLSAGCAAPQQPIGDELRYSAKTFNKSYDEVWDAVEEVVADDLMIPIKEKNKERGIIKSDWISIIRIRGTLRWNVKILLESAEDATRVKVYDRVEEPFSEKAAVEKMKKKDEISTGWLKSQEKIPEVDQILIKLSEKLGE